MIFSVCAFFLISLGAAPRPPDPQELLRCMLDEPRAAFQGILVIDQNGEGRGQKERIRVYGEPPSAGLRGTLDPPVPIPQSSRVRWPAGGGTPAETGPQQPSSRYRWEWLSVKGKIRRAAFSDGETIELYSLKPKRIYRGNMDKISEKFLSKEEQLGLILKNYEHSLLGRDHALGKSVWILRLDPKDGEKPSFKIWIDEATHLVLRAELLSPAGDLLAGLRWELLETFEDLPDGLFRLEDYLARGSSVKGIDPKFLTKEEVAALFQAPVALMDNLSGGFVFESASQFEFRGKPAYHIRYTDGLTRISIFMSEKEVSRPDDDASSLADSLVRPGFFLLSSYGQPFRWKKNRWQFVMRGHVAHDFLVKLASGME